MSLSSRGLAVATLLLAVSACGRSAPISLGGRYMSVVDVAPEPVNDIDLLFVIDDSGSMAEEQAVVATRAREAFFQALEQGLGTSPNLHVAVVSTNMGTGPANIVGCDNGGDDGRFLTGSGCPQTVTGTFLSDVAGDAGARVTNFTGSFDDEFACMVQLGTNGCGFERPFDAMRHALDGTHAENAGFLRPEALLVVVVLTDEDDCSADPALFDPNDTELEGPLGPLDSYRCFEFGVTCDEVPDVRGAGPRTNCRPSDDSPYVIPVGDYTSFLAGLKGDPTKVMVIGISGSSSPVRVDPNPSLAPACPPCNGQPCPESPETAPVLAYPSFRVPALVEAFPARSSWNDLCAGGTEAALRRGAATVVNVAAGRPCLTRAPVDVDAAAAGTQADCRGFDVSAPLTADEQRVSIATCAASGGAEPCFEVVADETCAASGTPLMATRRGAAADTSHFVVECLID